MVHYSDCTTIASYDYYPSNMRKSKTVGIVEPNISNSTKLEGKVTTENIHGIYNATVQVIENNTVIEEVQTEDDGTYEIELPDGTYDVKINKPSYLSYTIKDILVQGETEIQLNTINLAAGEIVEDGVINLFDVVRIISYFYDGPHTPEGDLKHDLNEDGIVDMSDVDIVMNNALVNPVSTEQEEQYVPASPNIQGITTYQIWLGDEIAIDKTGNNIVSYIHGYKLIKSDYGYYHYNAHGDVVNLTDNSGVVVKAYGYSPYGVQLQTPDSMDLNPYRFCGEYYDAETGYTYLRARYFDPNIGRFINEDPALDGYNWYIYCGNNPVNRWDPSGEAWYHWAIGAGIVAGLAITTLATAGTFTLGAVALGMAGSGVSIGGATGVFAAATLGSGVMLGAMAFGAAMDSRNIKDFNNQGNWGTVAWTAGGALVGGGLEFARQKSVEKAMANKVAGTNGKGFNTFSQYKKEMGSAGKGNEWHHIVEKNQIAKSGFNPQQVHNTNNIIAIDKSTHTKISGYYNKSTLPFTNGLKVRNWLVGQSFETQYKFGIDILMKYGVIK